MKAIHGSGPTVNAAGAKADLIAGLTAAAVVLPKSMAYATVAGLPVSVGLYTAFVPMIVYALIGSSRVLSFSSTTTLAILTATQLGLAVPDGDLARLTTATATLTALTGLILVMASMLRLGFVANLISAPVLTGFKAGIGLVIVLDQIPKILGIHFEKEGFFRDIVSLVQHLPAISVVTVVIGAGALSLLALAERIRPHSPAALAVIAGAIAAVWLFGLDARGLSIIGHIPPGLPPLTLPDSHLVAQLLPGAAGIALMSFTESIAAGRAFIAPEDPPIRPNRELLATGAANLSGAILGAMPAGGGTSQTAVVRAVGGRSQRASLVTAMISTATMLLLSPLLGLLPNAVLAAVVIVYSVGLIQPADFAAILRVRRMEYIWALAAFLGVLVFGTLQGIVIAIMLSMVGLASQAANPSVLVIARKQGEDLFGPVGQDGEVDEPIEGLLILRPVGRLFFANAQGVADRIRTLVGTHRPAVLLLDLSRVFDIEFSALQSLDVEEQRFAREGVAVWISGMNPGVAGEAAAYGIPGRLGKDRVFPDLRSAVRQFSNQSLKDTG
ncbi:STAS domain-containing protein [Tabrizicola sp. J26]|uniref:SulP family inorganic anion transporter n=1 Tax=Alitabrizicola rongguiensis TaxID=2909234 RepID=UPI001EEA419D|nr:SulP family inorganic anion transporter [Tabrizicola rongguiensis]MCF1708266.1 STAS domain-containing protein [Tabrizicola rongguiensis]